jgi:PAS domain S-box-containing protein
MLMVVSRAITSSDGTAPTKGSIIFASLVDEEVAQDISVLTHLSVTFQSIFDVRDDTRARDILDHLKAENEPYVVPASDDDRSVYGYTFKNDLDGNKALLMGVESDRAIFEHGKGSILLFTRILIGVSILVVIIVLYLFERLVLNRLFRLGRAVENVEHDQDTRAHVTLPGDDEFSHLANRIDTMLSELHDVEVKRKESEKRFRTVADSAPVMIWMSDVDQKCTYVNKVWLDHTGRALADELGHGWKSDIHPDDVKRSDEAYAHAFARQQAFSIEYRIKGKDGAYMWVFARAVPHFTTDGLFLGYIGSCVDITERKAAEERRLGYIEEIEKMNRIMVERELKMIELKEKIKRLERHA